MFEMLKKYVSRQRLVESATQRPACRARLKVEELECRLTPSAPGAVSLVATPVASSQINLAWSGGSGANGFYFDEWTASGWTTIANLGASSSSYAVTGLNANTTYYFDVGAYNASGTTWAPNYVWATTYESPPAAFSFTARAYSASQINLTWSSVGAASGYYIDQWTGSAWTQIATLGAGSTSYAATGLAANTTYYFDVGASNAYGTTWATNWQSAVTGKLVDHPAAGAGYVPVYGSLFGANGPSYLDVQQGVARDCWLLASLAEVAARNPADITSMFSYAGTTIENGSTVSLYSVRFYNNSGLATYVTVDTELPGGGSSYDQPANNVLWVALAEKAYAQANGMGMVTTQNVGSDAYSALNGGYPYWALDAITGKTAGYYVINPTDAASAWNAGQLVVMCTGTPVSSDIVGNHCYAMVAYNASSSMPFELFNPWGTNSSGWAPGTYNGNPVYGLFNANAAFVSQNFITQAVGTGAAPGMVTTPPTAPSVANFEVSSAGAQGNMLSTPATTVSSNLVATTNESPFRFVEVSRVRADAIWTDGGHPELAVGLLDM